MNGELAKMPALAEALADSLKARGVEGLRAVLAARTRMAPFAHATISWLDAPVPWKSVSKRLSES